jgi:hypothetical protein
MLLGFFGTLLAKPSPTAAEREKLFWDWEHGRINSRQYFALRQQLDRLDRKRN